MVGSVVGRRIVRVSGALGYPVARLGRFYCGSGLRAVGLVREQTSGRCTGWKNGCNWLGFAVDGVEICMFVLGHLVARTGSPPKSELGMTEPFTVAIDGPAAAGKGTLSKEVARHFGFAHI